MTEIPVYVADETFSGERKRVRLSALLDADGKFVRWSLAELPVIADEAAETA